FSAHLLCPLCLPSSLTLLTSPLPLHAALPICLSGHRASQRRSPLDSGKDRGVGRRDRALSAAGGPAWRDDEDGAGTINDSKTRRDRKSTRLNSSHGSISYAVSCLKNKNNKVNK